MNYEYRCLICDWTWCSNSLGEKCPQCNEYNDVYVAEKTFECGSFGHYQEYLKSREPFDETPLTYK